MRKTFNSKWGIYKKYNVMTPLSWMSGCFFISLIYAVSKNHNNWVGICSMLLIFMLAIGYFSIYIFFAKTSPDRLQTEYYNLAQQEINALTTSNTNIKMNTLEDGKIPSESIAKNDSGRYQLSEPKSLASPSHSEQQ
jgi:hypothetical protein